MIPSHPAYADFVASVRDGAWSQAFATKDAFLHRMRRQLGAADGDEADLLALTDALAKLPAVPEDSRAAVRKLVQGIQVPSGDDEVPATPSLAHAEADETECVQVSLPETVLRRLEGALYQWQMCDTLAISRGTPPKQEWSLGHGCTLQRYPEFVRHACGLDPDDPAFERQLQASWDFLDAVTLHKQLRWGNVQRRKNVSSIRGHGQYLPFGLWPDLLRTIAMNSAAAIGLPLTRFNQDGGWFVHANLYKDGIGIDAHADGEVGSLGYVFSVTLNVGSKSKRLPREFEVSNQVRISKRDRQGRPVGGTRKKWDQACPPIALKHCDGCCMLGSEFQDRFWHRIKTMSGDKWEGHLRINMTFRPFVATPRDEASADARATQEPSDACTLQWQVPRTRPKKK